MLVVRASQRATISAVCEHEWLRPPAGEAPVDREGFAGPIWDEGVAARLDAMGCPLALVQHHVMSATGTTNHVTAAYEILQHGEKQPPQPQPA